MQRTRLWRRVQTRRVSRGKTERYRMTEPRTELRYFDQKLGRVVLKHPRDCGRAECKICHPHKYAGNSLKYKTARNVRERTQTRMMTIDLRETSLAA